MFLGVVSSAVLADGMKEPQPVPAWPSSDSVATYQMPLGSPQVPSQPIQDGGWTGGASYTPPGGMPLKEGLENPRMSLANKELMVDDGGQTVGASVPPTSENSYAYGSGSMYSTSLGSSDRLDLNVETETYVPDMSRDWTAEQGQTLKEILKLWALQEGWEVVWNTHRQYPLSAGAIFKGRFTDVASALIRTFGRASPPPYARFYYGNRVLVVKTLEDENAD
ncbi:MAG: toxin co-regulated pilus biosynthesis Q family protein [Alphaproteobacteria bacterium]|nr:toxin co-regulated pilus biosynthesis Q family protein [Alphaproteobacteria bacterium]